MECWFRIGDPDLCMFCHLARTVRTASGSVKSKTRTGIKSVVDVASGSQHTAALLSDGSVFTWGVGEQGQLGIRVVSDRNKASTLTPRAVGFPALGRNKNDRHISKIFCGA